MFSTLGNHLSVDWDIQYLTLMLAMWWVMMVAMMLPSATPTILLAAAINRRSNSHRTPYGKTLYFTLGYLLVWLGFSLVAVLGQWWLESQNLMTAMMQNNSQFLAAGLLIAAGVWQLTPIKYACLRHCQSPVKFLVAHRRPGNLGALKMGMHHGCYCLGCCWFLMCLLFVVCIMNLYWIIGLTLFVILEKYCFKGLRFARISGVILSLAGLGMFLI